MNIIPTFQRGGGFTSAFSIYEDVDTGPMYQQRLESASTKSLKVERPQDDDKGKLTEKDFFSMIKDIDGLPNEMNGIVRNLQETFSISNLLGTSPQNLTSMYLSNLQQIKIAAQNKAKYDEAKKKSDASGSNAEPAITLDGNILVQDSNGEMQKVSLNQYYSNQSEYIPLNVSNILHLRAYSSNLINDLQLFDVVENSVGLEEFQKLVQSISSNVGSSSINSSTILTVDLGAVLGLQALQSLPQEERVKLLDAVSSNGEYTITNNQDSNILQISYLIQYINAVMPERMKTWAAMKTGILDKDAATNNLITTFLLLKTDTSHTLGISKNKNYDEERAKAAAKAKAGGDDKSPDDNIKATFLTSVQTGQAGTYQERVAIRGKIQQGAKGVFYGANLTPDGKVVTDASVELLLKETNLAGLTDMSSIVFGDKIVTPNALKYIGVENTGGFRAVLPATKVGNTVTPNFDIIPKFQKLVDEVDKEYPNATLEEKNARLAQLMVKDSDLSFLVNSYTGELDSNLFHTFYIVDGISSDMRVDMTDTSGDISPYYTSTDEESDKKYYGRILSHITTGKGKKQKTEKLDTKQWYNPAELFFGLYDKLYKASVYIPLNVSNRLAGTIFSALTPKNSAAQELEQEYQIYNSNAESERIRQNSSPNILFK